MTCILRIDSSSRSMTEGSHSRRVADRIVSHLQNQHPDAQVITRDLIAAPLPHISNDTITGFYTPDHQMMNALRDATALSDTLIEELSQANLSGIIDRASYDIDVSQNAVAPDVMITSTLLAHCTPD